MKAISILILLSFLLSFTACAQGTDTQKSPVTTVADTASAPDGTQITFEEDELPENLNFGGQAVRFLIPEGDAWDCEITVEEYTSEPVNDSIYNRELFVESRLGVEIESEYIDPEKYNDKVTLQKATDEDTYQIYAARTVFFAPLVFENYLYDFYDVDYIDLQKPWWSQNFTDAAEFKDSLFLATGSLALSVKRFLIVTYYNKTLAENYSAAYPELGDLYSLVASGDWTIDKLTELSSNVYNDRNGSTTRDEEDTFGLLIDDGISADTIWSSFDIDILGKDDDDWFTLDVNVDKLYTALDKIMDLYHETVGSYMITRSDTLVEMSKVFANDSALFMVNRLLEAEDIYLRNMNSDYGILPYPKYDKAQENYYSYAHDQYLSFSIPLTNPSPDVAGAVLEAMSSYSYRDTEPIYLDFVLKGKYMSDAQSRNMIDLVVRGFKVDSAWIYSRAFGDFGPVFRDNVVDNNRSYATTYAKAERSTNLKIKALGGLFKD